MNDELSKITALANPAQLDAITHGTGPLLIVAGAGTGKTSVLTKRLGHLVLSGKAKADEVLAVTFTEKAAGEMEERIDKLLPYGYVDLWVMTFHALGEKILRSHGLTIGLPDTFKLLSETEQWLLIRNNLDRFTLEYYRPLGNPTKFIHALLRHFSRAKDELITPAEYLAYAESVSLDSDTPADADERSRVREVANAYHVYTQLLRENDALDFGDLINETVRLFKERPAVLAKYRKQFKYVIVDEFQDTNIAQFELIRLLAGDEANLTVVGDDDQSVYKFRGASVSNILQFKEFYPKAREVVLTDNYRSPQLILDTAYSFIQKNNPNRLEAQLGEGLSKKLRSHSEHAGVVEHLHAESVFDEAKLVAKKIRDIIATDPETNYSECAILVRANDSANPFITALQQEGIPYLFMASRGLYQKPVLLDILSYLRLLDNYHESPALYRLLSGQVVNLSHDDLVKLTHTAHKKSLSLYETLRQAPALQVSEDGVKKVTSFLGLIEKHTQLARTADARSVIFSFLEDSGYLRRLVGEDNELNHETLQYINQFWKEVESFVASDAEPTAKRFLERVRMELEAGETGTLPFDPNIGPEAVKVLTVHASKGLEFDNIFVVSLVDRKFPSTERGEPIELPDALIKEALPEGEHHLEEERRLMYVAMTRAKKRLYLTSGEDYGGARKKKPSRFLVELGFVEEKKKAAEKNDSFGTRKTTPKAHGASPLSIPKQFSFTQLKTFETCPLQYKFAHILRIPVRGKGNFSFGKTIHAALQKFFMLVAERQDTPQASLFAQPGERVLKNIGSLATVEELLKLYEQCWIDDWYESAANKQEYREKGKKILRAYYASVHEHVVEPLHLEKPFYLKIGDATLKGAIDRIDRLMDGTVRIIDYKTGKPKADDEVDKQQLLIYQMAAAELLGVKPSSLVYTYLENASNVEFLGTDEEITNLKTELSEAIEKIRASDFHPTPSKPVCDNCDFRDICEFRVR